MAHSVLFVFHVLPIPPLALMEAVAIWEKWAIHTGTQNCMTFEYNLRVSVDTLSSHPPLTGGMAMAFIDVFPCPSGKRLPSFFLFLAGGPDRFRGFAVQRCGCGF